MCEITIKEASKKYNLSERKIRYLISDTKNIPSKKINNKRYIIEKDIKMFLERELLISLEPLTRIKKVKYVGNENYQFDVPKSWISFLEKNGFTNNTFFKRKKDDKIIYLISTDLIESEHCRLMYSRFNNYDRFRLFVSREDLVYLQIKENDLIEINLNIKNNNGSIILSKNPLEFKNFYSITELSIMLNVKKHFLYLLAKNNFLEFKEINYEVMIPQKEMGKLISIIKKNFDSKK